MNLSDLSIRDLKKAITLKTRVEKLQSQLSDLLGGNGKPGRKVGAVKVDGRKRRRKMSPAAKAKIAAAQRARWAKVKAG